MQIRSAPSISARREGDCGKTRQRPRVLGALSLAYLGDKQRALDWISRAMTIEPEDVRHDYDVACALAQLNEPNQALDQLEHYASKMAPERINWIKRDADL